MKVEVVTLGFLAVCTLDVVVIGTVFKVDFVVLRVVFADVDVVVVISRTVVTVDSDVLVEICITGAVVVVMFETVSKVEFGVLRVVFADVDVVVDTLGTVLEVDFDVFGAVVTDVGVVVVIF